MGRPKLMKSKQQIELEKRIEDLEKRVATLEGQVQEQLSTEEVVNRIKETLKKEIDIAATIDY